MNSPLMERLIGTHLPLADHLQGICAAVGEGGALVIRSDPGSGKSTLVPLALMESLGEGRILVLEPRRAAALGIAGRMAELAGEPVGGLVGYAVRLLRQVSARTRVEVITEGLLVRRLQNDPELKGVSTVIFDEFHERSVHTDLSLAMVMDLRRMGSAVNIVVMSATMDADAVAAFINAPVIECPGRVFPVDISYRPIADWAPGGKPLGKAVGEALGNILHNPGRSGGKEGNILVFLPGRREIDDARSALNNAGFDHDFDLFSLHGSMPLDKQRELLSENSNTKRRIILSTNVAETGLTIPGVTLVVDSGFARLERYHIPSGMNRLSMEAVSRQSAEQRAGRAGRLMSGRCVRLWAENDVRPAETECEIRRTDLSSLVLDCLLWGVKNREDLPWLEVPPASSWDRALELLKELGAIDAEGHPTGIGRVMADLGLEPRLARLCIAGKEQKLASLGCASAAILSDRDGSGVGPDPDFRLRLSIFRGGKAGLENKVWVERTVQTVADLLKRLGLANEKLSWTMEAEAGVGELLGTAFPDRIARRRDDPAANKRGGIEGVFRFSSGREGRLAGPLAASEWIVAAEVDAGERQGFIRLAAPVTEETALALLGRQIREESRIEWKGLTPRSIAVKLAGRIPLSEERRRSRREEIIPALPGLLKETGIVILPWEDEAGHPRRLLERIRFFNSNRAKGSITCNEVPRATCNEVPRAEAAWTDAALINDADQWLGPFVWEGAESGSGPIISGKGLADALAARLGWETKKELDRQAPEYVNLPKGRRRPIDYSTGEPVLRIRLQDAFGIKEASILSVPIVFHLLSPADRPIQVTRDLPGFWKGSYAEVRKEMRGRYPKHFWPESGD
ncbi:ATP-dependent helicase HrpB [Treponema primitia]|uniref:ATP-dependent helicase HrpB n=1 Tax=Treponema primitia TaxID=88058 RepID=UPI000255576B|nr:ATP-dependent helicase HrpB [Treponema primitia]